MQQGNANILTLQSPISQVSVDENKILEIEWSFRAWKLNNKRKEDGRIFIIIKSITWL